ncbi:hypothetical protein HanIR_Chr17g0849841 [Helianthus annuus]|nr:hypothetical protein HanIR_Chr17g0849841 [Helianthus annuus]
MCKHLFLFYKLHRGYEVGFKFLLLLTLWLSSPDLSPEGCKRAGPELDQARARARLTYESSSSARFDLYF